MVRRYPEIIYIDKNPNNLDEGFAWIEVATDDVERFNIPRLVNSTGRWVTRQREVTVTKYDKDVPYQETYINTYNHYINLPQRGRAGGKKFTLNIDGELVTIKTQKSLTTNAVCAWVKTWASPCTKIITPGNRQISLDGDKLAHYSYFVYFILNEDSNAIKIGKAKDVSKRMKSLQTSSPAHLKLIKSIQVDTEKEAQALEQSLHVKFQEIRLAGEWFKADASLLEYISQVQN